MRWSPSRRRSRRLPEPGNRSGATPVGRLPFPERGYVIDLPESAAIGRRPGDHQGERDLGRRLRLQRAVTSGLRYGAILAIDASDSMQARPEPARSRAARSFVAHRGANEAVGVVTFNGVSLSCSADVQRRGARSLVGESASARIRDADLRRPRPTPCCFGTRRSRQARSCCSRMARTSVARRACGVVERARHSTFASSPSASAREPSTARPFARSPTRPAALTPRPHLERAEEIYDR